METNNTTLLFSSPSTLEIFTTDGTSSTLISTLTFSNNGALHAHTTANFPSLISPTALTLILGNL